MAMVSMENQSRFFLVLWNPYMAHTPILHETPIEFLTARKGKLRIVDALYCGDQQSTLWNELFGATHLEKR